MVEQSPKLSQACCAFSAPLVSGPLHVLCTLPGTLHLYHSGLSLEITFVREAAANPTLWIYPVVLCPQHFVGLFPNLPKAQCCELQNGHSNTSTAGLLWGEDHRVSDKAWNKGSSTMVTISSASTTHPVPSCAHIITLPPGVLVPSPPRPPSPSPNIHCFHDALGVAANFNDED